MTLFSRILFSVCLLALCSLGTAWAGSSTTSSPGSTLLTTLWTPQELAGAPSDPHVSARHEPDDTPPEQRAPTATLPALAPELDPVLAGSIRRVNLHNPADKVVALTFDLCELATKEAGYDNRIVNALRQTDTRATFFAGGKWMRTHPEQTMQMMADPRFELGNHGWTHGNLGVMSREAADDQIGYTQAQYELLYAELATRAMQAGLSMDHVKPNMELFRFPYGRCNDTSKKLLAGYHLPAIQWDVLDTNHSSHTAPNILVEAAMARISPGSIMLMHANGVPRQTWQVIEPLIRKLAHKGYRFVTVSELLALGDPVTDSRCYFLTPGDNLNLDAIYGDGTRHPVRKK